MTDTAHDITDRVLYRLEMDADGYDSDDLAQARLLLQTAQAACIEPNLLDGFDPRHALQVLAQIDNGYGCWLEPIDEALANETDENTPLVAAYNMAKVMLFQMTQQRMRDQAKKD